MSIIKTCVSEKKKKNTLGRKTEKMNAPHVGAQRTEVSSLKPPYEECHVQMQCLSRSMGIRIAGLGDFTAYMIQQESRALS